MQKTRYNYFGGSKQRNIIIHQRKMGKHECGEIAATYRTKENGSIKLIYNVSLSFCALALTNFHLMKGRVTLFPSRKNCIEMFCI